METNLYNEIASVIDLVIDQSICPDCEHPRCLDNRKAAIETIESISTTYSNEQSRLARATEGALWLSKIEYHNDIDLLNWADQRLAELNKEKSNGE